MQKPEIVIIAALGEQNRVIGKDGKVPWHIPEDSERFRRLTLRHPVIMGRVTWEHDLEGKPLSKRHNIVVSRSADQLAIANPRKTSPWQLLFVPTLTEALRQTQGYAKVFIIGGAMIYAQALGLADTLELTLVEGEHEGDTFFPEYAPYLDQFQLVKCQNHSGFRYETYRRSPVMVPTVTPAATPALQMVE